MKLQLTFLKVERRDKVTSTTITPITGKVSLKNRLIFLRAIYV